MTHHNRRSSQDEVRYRVEARGFDGRSFGENWLHLRFMDEPSDGWTLAQARARCTPGRMQRIAPINTVVVGDDGVPRNA